MDLSTLFGKLISEVKRSLFIKDVEWRVRALEGGSSPSKTIVESCPCATCVAARLFMAHRNIAGDPKSFDPTCPCHNCVSEEAGEPGRQIPSDACGCELCDAWRKEPPDIRWELIGLGDGASADSMPIDVMRSLLSGIVNSPASDLEEKQKRFVESAYAKSKTLQLASAYGREPDPAQVDALTNALLGLPDGKVEQPDTQQEGTGTMTNPKGNIVDNRAVVDIGGKESPRFETKGTVITVPEGMDLREGAEWLLKQHAEMEQAVAVNETLDGFPLDAAMALNKAIKKMFGWAKYEGQGWFGLAPPDMISVEIGVGQYEQVAWGNITLPGIDGFISPCAAHPKDGRPTLTIHGSVKKKHRQQIAELANEARRLLRTESIYKGKAIKVTFPEEEYAHGQRIDLQDMPTFYDTSKVDPSEIVFSKSVEDQIRVSLFTPIEHTQACRDAKIPLKRTVLFAGPYGVGKTLTAAVTAQTAVKHGWTFILIESAEDLAKAVEFSKQYEEAVIFCEDIDSVMKGERTIDMDGVLNIVDGIESKGRELMIVLTTNHPEKINKAMMRPGRVDAYIEVTPPDADAAQRLVRVYARDLLEPGVDLTEVGELLKGHKPASVREVVEKAKLASLANHNGNAEKITALDLVTAANIMKPHFALMEEKAEVEDQSLDSLLRRVVREALMPDHAPPNGRKGQEARA